ncbi:MAG TPA: cation:proton antiporter, partial [Candidatus Sumerlaeota bacterium]|nr:cation:proton antiporter [Candidatus Sumerlaeota bacterium]
MGGLTFLIMFLILMAMLSVIPQFLRRYYIPAVVSMIIIGIIIGPNALDLIGKMNVFLGRGYPTAQLHGILEAMGLLGLVFLMALAGMEVDLRIIRAERFAVFWLSFLTFTIPAIAGYFVYDWFMPDDTIGKWVYASLFASHSVGIVFPVIREMNVVHSRFGIAVLASTVITDIASLVLFGLCIQFKRHEIPGRVAGSISIFDHVNLDALGSFFPVIFIFSILFFMFLVMSLAPIIAKRILGRISPNDDSRITF